MTPPHRRETLSSEGASMEAEKCSNCGAVDLKEIGGGRLKCPYCDAIFRRPEPRHGGVELRIAKNAHVNILPSGHIHVRSTVSTFEVGEGADVRVAGELIMEKPGDPQKRSV